MCLSVCVHALKGKRLELTTPNIVDVQCMAVVQLQHARHDPEVARLSNALQCTVGMRVNRTAYVFYLFLLYIYLIKSVSVYTYVMHVLWYVAELEPGHRSPGQ